MDALAVAEASSIDAVDVARLAAELAARGKALDPASARWLAHRLAAQLAEAHANLDADGNVMPIVHGRLGPERVLVDVEGDVVMLDGVSSGQAEGGLRLTPRTDVYALGVMLKALVPSWEDVEIEAALATACEPDASRRRITCVELEALFGRHVDLDAARVALGACVRACLEPVAEPRELDTSRPLPVAARVAVMLATAAIVFTAGVAVAERWILR